MRDRPEKRKPGHGPLTSLTIDGLILPAYLAREHPTEVGGLYTSPGSGQERFWRAGSVSDRSLRSLTLPARRAQKLSCNCANAAKRSSTPAPLKREYRSLKPDPGN